MTNSPAIHARHPLPRPEEPAPQRKAGRVPAWLAYGFRPFFLFASLFAALAIPWWVALLQGLALPAGYLSPLGWHAHEMLYGFVAAAVAGFLLTAVPSWTGRRGYAGAPLVLLVLAWAAGRAAMLLPLGLPAWFAASLDLAFLPLLGLTILPALIRSGNRRNLVFIGLLALLFAANLRFHLDGAGATAALHLGYNTMLFMVAMLGGRILPAFTAAGLKQRGLEVRIRRYQPLDRAALLVVFGVVVIDVLAPGGLLASAAAAFAAALLAAQLCQWQGHRTLRDPLLWVLHLGYAWLPVSLALKSAWLLGAPLPPASWLHALGVGAMATMIIGIMSRAALGHTGRALLAPRPVVAGYLLLTVAALLRVFGPLLPVAAPLWMISAAALWSAAFLAYLVVFAPILCRPRVDGRPG